MCEAHFFAQAIKCITRIKLNNIHRMNKTQKNTDQNMRKGCKSQTLRGYFTEKFYYEGSPKE